MLEGHVGVGDMAKITFFSDRIAIHNLNTLLLLFIFLGGVLDRFASH